MIIASAGRAIPGAVVRLEVPHNVTRAKRPELQGAYFLVGGEGCAIPVLVEIDTRTSVKGLRGREIVCSVEFDEYNSRRNNAIPIVRARLARDKRPNARLVIRRELERADMQLL